MTARRTRTHEAIQHLQHKLSNASLRLFPDFQQRLAVLVKLGYVSEEDNAVALKGRVAAGINTADELLLTEMIFEGVFNDMEADE